MSGRSRGRADVAMAVAPMAARWSISSSSVHDKHVTAAGAPFRGIADEVLGIELAQPVQGERWPGAIAQRALTSST